MTKTPLAALDGVPFRACGVNVLNLLQSGIPKLEELLSPKLMARILRSGSETKVPDGKFVGFRNDVSKTFYLVVSGQIIAGSEGADGTFRTAGLMSPGNHFGEHTLLSGLPSLQNLRAVGDTVLRQYNVKQFFQIYNEEPDFGRALHVISQRQLHFIMEFMDGQRRWPLTVRIAHLLLTSVNDGHNEIGHTVHCRQEDLAEMLGVSRVAVNKALKALEADELTKMGYGNVELVDVVALRKWVNDNYDLGATIGFWQGRRLTGC